MANPPSSSKFDWKMFRYTPTLIGAIISLVIFLIMALLHLWQLFKLRQVVIIYIIIGAFCEVAGYGSRISCHFDNAAWGPFIVQGVFLLVGPLFFAATIYMMLGRTIVLAGGESVSLIKPTWYTRIFITADISTLVIQALGASIMGTLKLELALAGEKIVIAGLSLQVATFIVFLIASIDFHIRMNRQIVTTETTGDWKKMLYILIAHEWTLYVFDTVPMFLVLVLLLVLQPSKYVSQQARKNERSSSGEIEVA